MFVGKSVLRREDARLLGGKGQYVGDLELPGMLHAAFVRSPMAHHDRDAAHRVAGAALDQGNRRAVGMADEDRILNLKCLSQLGKKGQRFLMHEAHRAARLLEHLGLSVTVAVVHQRAAAGRFHHLAGKVAPLPDRA